MATDLLRYCEAQGSRRSPARRRGFSASSPAIPRSSLEGGPAAATTGSHGDGAGHGLLPRRGAAPGGQLVDALASIDGALDLAAATAQPFLDGAPARARGEAILADAARTVEERRAPRSRASAAAIEIAGAQEKRMFQLRAANGLARSCAATVATARPRVARAAVRMVQRGLRHLRPARGQASARELAHLNPEDTCRRSDHLTRSTSRSRSRSPASAISARARRTTEVQVDDRGALKQPDLPTGGRTGRSSGDPRRPTT